MGCEIRSHIFVFVREKFRVLEPFCEFPQESECCNWPVNDMPERVQNAVQPVSPDIGYLDLTPCLAEAMKRGEVPYYPDDLNWSPAGHKIAAEAISDYSYLGAVGQTRGGRSRPAAVDRK